MDSKQQFTDPQRVSQVHDHLQTVSFTALLFVLAAAVGAGIAFLAARRWDARWTWGLVWLLPLAEVVASVFGGGLSGAAAAFATAIVAGLTVGHLGWGGRIEIGDRKAGDDRGHQARERIGPVHLVNRWMESKMPLKGGFWPELQIGVTRRGKMAAIKRGSESGSHRLILGSTGSGKSTLLAVLAVEGAACGNAIVLVEGKIDPDLEQQARRAAEAAGAEFFRVSPRGDWIWDMLATGDLDETVAKLLACEEYSEPHHAAQATRFLRWAVRVARAAGRPLRIGRLLDLCEPDRLAAAAAACGDAELASQVDEFLESLSARERADIGGLRARLAMLAESDFGRRWLDPESGSGPVLNLHEAIERRAVIYFRLDADRLGIVAKKVGTALAIELGTIASAHMAQPLPTVVCFDEWGVIGDDQGSGLYARARGSGMSVAIAAQTLADLRVSGEAVEERVKGTVDSVVCFRVGPDDADAVARIAGQVGADQYTFQTRGALGVPSGAGTRTRGYRLRVHPSVLQDLAWGHCAVIRLDRNDDERVLIARVIPAWDRRLPEAGDER